MMARYNNENTQTNTNTTTIIPSFSKLWKFLIAGVAAAFLVASLGNNGAKSNTGGESSVSSSSSSRSLSSSSSSSSSSQQAIQPDLVFGDMNLLVVSDVHSFVGGHPHEPDKNADYGDLLSFHQRLRDHCAQHGNDLFLLNNGDILHGTGLAMDGNSTNLLPIVNALPWDAMAMGRQEATYSDVLRDLSKDVLPKHNYITSNVVWSETNQPYGERYALLQGQNNSTLLVFGFLYDTVQSSETIQVLGIEETLQQDWFRTALRQENSPFDAIVVLAQMDFDSPQLELIHKAIRSEVDPKMPLQLVAGRSHKRALADRIQKDRYTHKMEPGGLFDTIGFVRIPKFEFAQVLNPGKGLEKVFAQEFLNTSQALLKSKLGLAETEDLRTLEGAELSQHIQTTRQRLGLDQIVACPGHDYLRNISIHADNSLWKLWRNHVVRNQIFQKDEDRVMFVSKSSMRYDLKGSGKHDAMTLDDVVAIAPYMEKVIYVGDVPDWMIRRMNNTFNTFSHHNHIPDYVLAGDLDEVKTAESYKLYTHEVDVPKIKTKLEKFNFHDFVWEYTGQRDTLYWLDYVRGAMPCTGKQKQKQTFEVPYFYDPGELEEESTDGKLTSEDLGIGDGEEEGGIPEEDEGTWTLPPNEGYQGYVPGSASSAEVPSAVYENYKSKDEIDEEKRKAAAAKLAKMRGQGDIHSQLTEHKKTRKKIIKGFALTFAAAVLMVPVVCLILQIMGKNDYYDDYNDGGYGAAAMYDPQEMMMLRRRRKRGTQPTKAGESLEDAPFSEIEII